MNKKTFQQLKTERAKLLVKLSGNIWDSLLFENGISLLDYDARKSIAKEINLFLMADIPNILYKDIVKND